MPPTKEIPMKKLLLLACTALVFTAALAPSAPAAPSPRPVKVMSRNLYLGSDLTPALTTTSIPGLLAANAQIWSNVQQTSFPQRAKALAREIADADPTLIGLQEVERWYSGPIGDPAPATTVEFDFLATLRSELAAIGSPYDVVRVQPMYDVEAPAGGPYYRDFRLVDQDAILVKAGLGSEVKLSNAQSGHYDHNLVITTSTGEMIPVTRGWVSVDAVVNKHSFRFVDSHLEPFHPGIRFQQAQELVAPSGPVGSAPGKAILVGDMNSDPEQVFPQSLAFSALTGAGLLDSWVALHPGDPGLSCCFSELVNDPASVGAFDSRIDHVLVSPGVGLLESRLTGIDPDNRAAGGLWPSDHAGVVATLTP
jgi:endonuclease/exonuclease/phosphatase family metal-dependent hydrolase